MRYTIIFLILQVLIFTSVTVVTTFSNALLTVTSLILGKMLWGGVER